jgi:type IV pilus assembly protein PilC
MFAAGVPLVEAMDSVAKASGNIVFQETIQTMREQVATGQQLNLTMQLSNLFPPMAVQMVAIGEESGALDEMCAKIAEFYEEEVDNLVDQLSSLLEPMIMSILGVLVGGLVVAMYLPIFKLGQVV